MRDRVPKLNRRNNIVKLDLQGINSWNEFVAANEAGLLFADVMTNTVNNDGASIQGTPYSKSTQLSMATATTIFGADSDAYTVDAALRKLAGFQEIRSEDVRIVESGVEADWTWRRYNDGRWNGEFEHAMKADNEFTLSGIFTGVNNVRLFSSDVRPIAFPPTGFALSGISGVGIRSEGKAVGGGTGSVPTWFRSWIHKTVINGCSILAFAPQETSGTWKMVGTVMCGHAYGTWS